jgi:hypothetical protein
MGIRDCTQKRLMRNELESRKTRFLISLSPPFFLYLFIQIAVTCKAPMLTQVD